TQSQVDTTVDAHARLKQRGVPAVGVVPHPTRRMLRLQERHGCGQGCSGEGLLFSGPIKRRDTDTVVAVSGEGDMHGNSLPCGSDALGGFDTALRTYSTRKPFRYGASRLLNPQKISIRRFAPTQPALASR